jgi:hypothetical protein
MRVQKLLVALTVVSIGGAAAWAHVPVTLADVMASFQARSSGGFAIRAHHFVDTPPSDYGGTQPYAQIRPFPPFDGRHYCQDDYHLLAVSTI